MEKYPFRKACQEDIFADDADKWSWPPASSSATRSLVENYGSPDCTENYEGPAVKPDSSNGSLISYPGDSNSLKQGYPKLSSSESPQDERPSPVTRERVVPAIYDDDARSGSPTGVFNAADLAFRSSFCPNKAPDVNPFSSVLQNTSKKSPPKSTEDQKVIPTPPVATTKRSRSRSQDRKTQKRSSRSRSRSRERRYHRRSISRGQSPKEAPKRDDSSRRSSEHEKRKESRDRSRSKESGKCTTRSRSKESGKRITRSRSKESGKRTTRSRSRDTPRRRSRSRSRDHRRRSRSGDRRRRSRSGDRRRRSRSGDRRRRSRSRERGRSSYDRRWPRRGRSSSRDRYRRGHRSRSPHDQSRGPGSRKSPIKPSGSAVTPQMALQNTMRQMSAKAEALTGVALPRYYNPAAVNPMKYAEQVQKRKLLWSNAEKEEEQPKSSVWDNLKFAQDQDGKMTAKFRKLMGMKAEEAAAASGIPDIEQPSEDTSVLRKQETLFRDLDQQYEMARVTTHTQRGVGLGYSQASAALFYQPMPK